MSTRKRAKRGRQGRRAIDPAIRTKAMTELASGEKSMKSIAEELSLSYGTILNWNKAARKKGQIAVGGPYRASFNGPLKKPGQGNEVALLQIENAYLRDTRGITNELDLLKAEVKMLRRQLSLYAK